MTSDNKTSDKQITSAYLCNAYYPWQVSVWQKLYTNPISNKQGNNHFPHALLLAGIAGIGKKDFAFYLAKAMLCQTPETNPLTGQIEPCQSVSNSSGSSKKICRSCQLFNSGNHPDFKHITTPDDKKVIPVDSIRELIQWSVLTSQMGGRKLIIIEPAETMNPNASNSLLKTLEEPVSNTIILLLTNKKQALLPTIRSRCQTIDFPVPERQSAAQWLEGTLMQDSLKDSPLTEGIPAVATEKAKLLLSLASGAPLLALHLSQSDQLDARNLIIQYLLAIMNGSSEPVKIAEELFKQTKVKKKSAGRQSKSMSKNKSKQLSISAYDVVYWIDSIVADLARLAQNCQQDTITNTDFIENLQQLSHKLDLKKVLQLSDLINKAYYEIQGQININLLFERLLIDWKNCKI